MSDFDRLKYILQELDDILDKDRKVIHNRGRITDLKEDITRYINYKTPNIIFEPIYRAEGDKKCGFYPYSYVCFTCNLEFHLHEKAPNRIGASEGLYDCSNCRIEEHIYNRKNLFFNKNNF